MTDLHICLLRVIERYSILHCWRLYFNKMSFYVLKNKIMKCTTSHNNSSSSTMKKSDFIFIVLRFCSTFSIHLFYYVVTKKSCHHFSTASFTHKLRTLLGQYGHVEHCIQMNRMNSHSGTAQLRWQHRKHCRGY